MDRDTLRPLQDRIIHAQAELPVPVARAFAYFTRPELLESWLCEKAEIELQVGGRYELFWALPDLENDSTIGCRISALAEPQLLAFDWRSPRQFKAFANAADPLTHVVVSFAPVGAGSRVDLVHTGWRSAPEWEEARSWQERAWRGALGGLTQLVVPA
ncbi:MAG: SRPBCC domain-containing protein [Verrucomicrobia bacterium]|nr:SRPBCC domain-containing protein [Verrucomicrobiota bacterium]